MLVVVLLPATSHVSPEAPSNGCGSIRAQMGGTNKWLVATHRNIDGRCQHEVQQGVVAEETEKHRRLAIGHSGSERMKFSRSVHSGEKLDRTMTLHNRPIPGG